MRCAKLLILCAFCSVSYGVSAQNIHWIYGNGTVDNVSDRVVFEQQTTPLKWQFNLSGWDPRISYDYVNNWNFGDYTGSPSPLPLSNYQYGSDIYAGSGVQAFPLDSGGTDPVFSSFMNTTKSDGSWGENIQGSYLQYAFGENVVLKPFDFGVNAKINFQANVKIPYTHANANGASMLAMGFTLTNEDTGQFLLIGPTIYKNSPPILNGVYYDVNGMDVYGVGGTVDNNPFFSKISYTEDSTFLAFSDWRYYGLSVSYSNVVDAIVAINAKMADAGCNPQCRYLDANPEKYKFGMFYIGSEALTPNNGNQNIESYIGFSVKSLAAYIEY